MSTRIQIGKTAWADYIKTDHDFVFVESLHTNPRKSAFVRGHALKMLFKALIEKATNDGYSYIYGITNNNSVAIQCEKLGSEFIGTFQVWRKKL